MSPLVLLEENLPYFSLWPDSKCPAELKCIVKSRVHDKRSKDMFVEYSSYKYLEIRLVYVISSVEFFSFGVSQLILHLQLFDHLAAPMKEQKYLCINIACKTGTLEGFDDFFFLTIKETTLKLGYK